MIPRYLRFTQAIALTGVAASVGCGARTPSAEDLAAIEPETDAGTDAVTDARADTNVAETKPVRPGACISYGSSRTTCAAGGTCVWNDATGTADCRFDVIEGSVCGSIRCGRDCDCADPREGVCRCAGPVEGPLPPPDLPAVA